MRNSRALLSVIALASLSLIGGNAFAQETAPAAPATPAPGIVVSGVLETNITFNFNKPSTGENFNYYFNRKEGQFSLNLAEIQIAKAATPESRTGFTIKLIEGEVKRYNFIAADADSNNVLEAYGTMLIPLGTKELKFDAGQFETHVGYETVEIGTNNFFSHNYLFSIPSPFYNAGVRASYPASTKLTLNGYIYNRYNGRTDTGNRDLAPGFQVAYAISPASSVVLNGLTSRENLKTQGLTTNDISARQQNVLDLIYTNQANATTKFAFEGLYRFGKDDNNTVKNGKSYSFYGVAGYGIFGPVGLRAEYLADASGDPFILGVNGIRGNNNTGSTKKGNLGSVTLSYEPKAGLFPGLRTIAEVRYDYASNKVFSDEKGAGNKNSQTTLTLGQVYSF